MATIHAAHALTADGWHRDVRISIEDGQVTTMTVNADPAPGDERHAVIVPGLPNLHSHAFQRGMAGLSEIRGTATDSFWTWRDVMYRFALAMTPDQMEAIAAELYADMLEAGFTTVGEFHYLHHGRDGRPYDDVAEMAGRIAAAAADTGIGLTLLPVLYAHSNFAGAPPTDGQRRFVNNLDAYARLLDATQRHLAALDGARLGVAPHSLRAVTPEELSHAAALRPRAPLHIHAAEQVKEVEDCLAWSGARPVQWLLDNASVDRRWCLIHATHMTDDETRRLAGSGAVAGLCPITEASLGDGTFNGPVFMSAGGSFGVGSDSNILIGIPDELRQLEYSQRLATRSRNVLAASQGSTGETLYLRALAGGASALGLCDASLRVGSRADLIALDTSLPAFAGRPVERMLDTWIFATHRGVEAVWVAGRKLVEAGRHRNRDRISRRYAEVMRELRAL